jgi:CRP-like cAMP-binding protein
MVVQRLARWLLTTTDRMGRTQLALTQESFAIMLGVRRAGVSEAASALQRLGAIRVERAAITVVDRAALVTAACECYESIRLVTERAYAEAAEPT